MSLRLSETYLETTQKNEEDSAGTDLPYSVIGMTVDVSQCREHSPTGFFLRW